MRRLGHHEQWVEAKLGRESVAYLWCESRARPRRQGSGDSYALRTRRRWQLAHISEAAQADGWTQRKEAALGFWLLSWARKLGWAEQKRVGVWSETEEEKS